MPAQVGRTKSSNYFVRFQVDNLCSLNVDHSSPSFLYPALRHAARIRKTNPCTTAVRDQSPETQRSATPASPPLLALSDRTPLFHSQRSPPTFPPRSTFSRACPPATLPQTCLCAFPQDMGIISYPTPPIRARRRSCALAHSTRAALLCAFSHHVLPLFVTTGTGVLPSALPHPSPLLRRVNKAQPLPQSIDRYRVCFGVNIRLVCVREWEWERDSERRARAGREVEKNDGVGIITEVAEASGRWWIC
ncbi:hypothetical protein FPV67DRAFT_1671579 [Lyophyllum atratum]|nr:hypothetical protein FPV67DRAFT_1671579 [Lyophyllum atratum]